MSEKEMEHMNSIYKKLKTIKFEIIIVSIALFVLGLLLVIFPTASQEIICKGIGVALCVWGVLRLINYFRIAGSEILGSYGLVQGVVAMLAIIANLVCISVIIMRSIEQKKCPYTKEIWVGTRDYEQAMSRAE